MANLKYMELPLLPLRGMMIFPGMVLHFDVARPRSIAALEASLSSNQKIFLTAQKNEDVEEPTRDQLYEVGTVAVIRQVMNLPGENVRVLVEGEVRGILTEYRIEENYAACSTCAKRI